MPEGMPCLRCLAEISLSPGADAVDAADGYEVLEIIGRGGAGKVYRAVEKESGRVVALKVLGDGVLAGDEARRRFHQEAEFARRLDHPGIVRIHAVSGPEEIDPWLAMEFVEGRALSDLLRRETPAPRTLAAWMFELAEAVAHAHGQGVLHRDLKPSNVLITRVGKARLTDFGVARVIGGSQADLTRTGEVLGTPAYMAPEQAAGHRQEIGPAADVYGLGAVLYHGLTGRAPFFADSVASILHEVIHGDPVPPRRLNPSLPRDLETLCLRCMEKEPARRIGSASEVAEELQRFLDGRPLHCKPPSTLEKACRWAKRNVAITALLGALALSLAAGGTALYVQWRKTVAARATAERQADRANRDNYATSMREAAAAIEAGRVTEAKLLLDQWRPTGGATDYRGIEWHFLRGQSGSPARHVFAPEHEAAVTGIAFLNDGKRFITISQSGKPRLWDLATRSLLEELEGVGTHHESLLVAPDGSVILGDHGRAVVLCLNAETLRPVREFPGRHAALSGDGRWLATSLADSWNMQSGGRVEVFDFASGKSLAVLSDNARRCVFSPDGKTLAMAGADQGVTLFDTASWREIGTRLESIQHVHALAFTPDGSALAGCDWSGETWLWNLPGGTRRILHDPPFRGGMMTFSPDGKRGYLASADRLIHAFDLPGGTKSAKFGGHADEVWALAMTPDGSHFLSGGKDGRVMLWDARPDAARSVPVAAAMARPLFFPDGRRALLRPFEGPAQVLDLATLDLTPAASGGFVSAISPAAELVVLDTPGQRLSFRSSADGKVLRELPFEGQLVNMAASFGGRWLAIITRDGERTSVVRVDLTTGKADLRRELPESGFQTAAVSDDGRLLAYADGPVLHLHDLVDGNAPAQAFRNRFYQFKDLAFSPDGSRLAAANQDGRVRVFRSADLALLHDFRGHHFDSGSVGFSADGGTLISLGTREGLRFWRLDRGHEAGHIRVPECRDYLSLSPDGKHLVVMTRSGVSVLRAE